jgi:hypothetical protein
MQSSQLIDFDQFLNGNEEQKRAAVTGIADGFKNSGFMYVLPPTSHS